MARDGLPTSGDNANFNVFGADNFLKANEDFFFILFLFLIASANLYVVIRILKLEASISRLIHHAPPESTQEPKPKPAASGTPTEQTPLLSSS